MRKWKTFVQGRGLHEELASYSTTESAESVGSRRDPPALDGAKAKEIYEQIISEPPSFSKSTGQTDLETLYPHSSTPVHCTEKPKTLTLAQLMRLCEGNDVRNLEDYFGNYSEETDINACDQYGWTLLMTAAVTDSYECVELLLRLGSDWTLCDKSELTAFQLANKNRRTRICELIRNWVQNQESGGEEKSGDSLAGVCREHQQSYCEPCGVLCNDANQHDKSIAHLVSTQSPGSSTTHYGIPENNKGFQLMLKSGWERGGLGQSGEGQKFPVKTVLKRDRKGLGNDTVKRVAKVTHFDSFDTAAVEFNHKRTEAEKTVRKGQSENERSRERRKEINFRRDFYGAE